MVGRTSPIRLLFVLSVAVGLAGTTQAGPTPTPSGSATPTPTATSSSTPTSTPTLTPSGSASPTPTATSTSSATPTPSPTATIAPTPTATIAPSPTATFTPTATPTSTPAPTATPTPIPPDHFLCYKATTQAGKQWFIRRNATIANQFRGNPNSMTLVDLNGDSELDVVTANGISDDVSVLLGIGDGRFQAVVYYAAGDGPVAVAAADIDGNSSIDLVTADNTSGRVSVLLGNGDGSFLDPDSFAAGDDPSAVALANLDGDSYPDIVTANFGSDDVSVLLRNTNGQIQAPLSFAAGDGPVSVAVADLDGDNILDLVTANRNSNNVSVLLGNGDGTFQAPAFFAAGSAPASVIVADLDGDNVPDLATANRDGDNVSVLLGNGNGTFQAPVFSAAGRAPVAVAVASINSYEIPDGPDAGTLPDLPGDDFLDLVTANSGSDDVSMLLGNGDGSFQAPVDFAVGDAPISIATANLNHDSHAATGKELVDVVTANFNSFNVSVLLGRVPPNPTNNPDVRFRPVVRYVAVARIAEVIKVKRFCNAVDKNGEGLVNPDAHLTCYEVRGRSPVRPQVVSTDQFGDLQLDVRKQRTELCLPSQLTYAEEPAVALAPPPLDAYELYSVGPTRGAEKFQQREVSVVDAFMDDDVELKKPVRLGVPTQRSPVATTNSFHHLTCYTLKAPKFQKRNIQMTSAFGALDLTVKKPDMLCAPSLKHVVSEGQTISERP